MQVTELKESNELALLDVTEDNVKYEDRLMGDSIKGARLTWHIKLS